MVVGFEAESTTCETKKKQIARGSKKKDSPFIKKQQQTFNLLSLLPLGWTDEFIGDALENQTVFSLSEPPPMSQP